MYLSASSSDSGSYSSDNESKSSAGRNRSSRGPVVHIGGMTSISFHQSSKRRSSNKSHSGKLSKPSNSLVSSSSSSDRSRSPDLKSRSRTRRRSSSSSDVIYNFYKKFTFILF